MNEREESILSPQQFLALEKICDSFEQSLYDDSASDPESFIASADVAIQDLVKDELSKIYRDFLARMESDTFLSQDHTQGADEPVTRLGSPPEEFGDIQIPQPSHQTQNLAKKRFGKFELLSIIGRGGSSVVWRAFDPRLNRFVALKIPNPNSVMDSRRFVREAKAVAQLKHPNIIPVFEAGQVDEQCYLASEYVDGQPLSQFAKNRCLPVRDAVQIVLSITRGIQHSHAAGIVHRDLKPQNIILSSDGEPLITDFGLAKNLHHDQTLTLDGELIGTPLYMAPEQANGSARDCDEKTDIYSIGVILFRLLSGRLPFNGSFERIVYQVINCPAPDLRSIDGNLPSDLAVVCARCLEKQPEQRFQTAELLASELQRFLDGTPIQSRPVSLSGRYTRWLRREPKLAWTVTICLVALIAAAFGSTLAALSLNDAWKKEKQLVNSTQTSLEAAVEAKKLEEKARARAVEAESLAERKALLAQQMALTNRRTADFLTNFFSPIDLIGINDAVSTFTQTRSKLSDEAVEQAEQQVEQLLSNDPIAQSRMKIMLANAWRSRGKFDRAQRLLQQATQEIEDGEFSDELVRQDRATIQLYSAYLCHELDQNESAEMHYRTAVRMLEYEQNHPRVETETDSNDVVGALRLAQAEFGLGALLMSQKRNTQAAPFIQSALSTRRELLSTDDPLRLITELVWIQCNSNHGLPAVQMSDHTDTVNQGAVFEAVLLYWNVLRQRENKQYETAAKDYEDLIDLIKINVGQGNPIHILATGDFAGMLWRAGDYKKAYPNIKQAIEESGRLFPAHDKRLRAMLKLASELRLAHRHQEAAELYFEIERLCPKNWKAQEDLNLGLAWTHLNIGRPEKAIKYSSRQLERVGKCTAGQTAWYYFTHAKILDALQNRMDKVDGNRGQTSDDKNNTAIKAEAEKYHNLALETVQKMILRNQYSSHTTLPQHSTWLKRLGFILTHHQQHESAESIFREALRFAEQEYFDEHPRVAGLKTTLAQNLLKQNEPEQAKRLLIESLQVQEKCLPEDDHRTEITRNELHDFAQE